MDRTRAHAVLVVAGPAPAPGAPRPVREFRLLAVEREPEPHFQDTPVGSPAEAGTLPRSRAAIHGHWVESDPDPPHAGPKDTRAAPYDLREVLVSRGPVGDLLAQEFLDRFAEADRLLALQADVDRARAAVDATAWDDARRDAIEAAQRRLDDAFYASEFPDDVVLVVLSAKWRGLLAADLAALQAPRSRLVDLSEAAS